MKRRADPNVLLQVLEERQLNPALAQRWSQYARPNIQLIPTGTEDLDNLPYRSSKLGGAPDLPAGKNWPTRPAYSYERKENDFRPDAAWQPRPLHFIAQIDLGQVEKIGCDLPLPASGHLLFFYDAEVQPWGFDPRDAIGWQVIYVGEAEETVRGVNPRGESNKACSIQFAPSESLPGWEWIQQKLFFEGLLNHKEFSADLEKLSDSDHERISYRGHSFGGWPSPVQAPMELECEIVSNGLYAGSPEGYRKDTRMPEFREKASDWRLLLQVNFDDDLGWMWGDGGMIYFMCREDDIAKGRFERVWTILQCG